MLDVLIVYVWDSLPYYRMVNAIAMVNPNVTFFVFRPLLFSVIHSCL
jgi:hypothetical protein